MFLEQVAVELRRVVAALVRMQDGPLDLWSALQELLHGFKGKTQIHVIAMVASNHFIVIEVNDGGKKIPLLADENGRNICDEFLGGLVHKKVAA